MHVTFRELKRFLTDNLKFILIGTLILAVIMSASFTYLDTSKSTPSENEDENEDDIVLEASSAYFKFYSEYDEGDQFTNVGLIREFLNLDAVKEAAEKETGINIQEIETHFNEKFSEFDDEFTVLKISRNSNNNVFTVTINTGNEEDNLILANHYYQLLMKGDLEFLDNKNFYTFIEPKMLVEEHEEVEEVEESKPITPSMVVKNSLIGLVVGFILFVGIALLKAIFGKNLNYAFAYNIKENDKFLLFDSKRNHQGLLNTFVNLPYNKNRVLLIENYDHNTDMKPAVKELLKNIDTNHTKVIPLLNNLPNNFPISEITVIIEPYKTTRKWYNNQLEIADLYSTATKIVQVND